jgi:hypothetical protein
MSAIESPVADFIYDTANLDKNGRIVDEITTICPVEQYRDVKQFREFACIFVQNSHSVNNRSTNSDVQRKRPLLLPE